MGTLVFLQPWFLVGAAAALAPLLIHLIQRRKKRRVAFSTLRFLMQTDRRSARRYRLVDLLVMLLRMALLALVALALAQPMLRPNTGGPKGAGAALGTPTLALVIDDSLSMQATAGGARLFDKALEAARRVLSDMPQEGEAFVVLTSGRQPKMLAAPTSPPASLIDALGALNCSYGGRTLAAAVNEAVATLRQGRQPHKALIVVGDRQARELAEAASLERAALEQVVHSATFIDVGGAEPDNVGLVEAAAIPPVGLPGMPLRIRAKVFNSTDAPASATVSLWLGGEKSAERTVSLPARGPGEVSFSPVLKEPGTVRALLKLEPDALAGDDVWYLPLRVLPSVRALLVTPPGAAAGESLYLRLALSPAPGRAGAASPLLLREIDYARAGVEPLGDCGIIFLVSAPDLPAPLMQTLEDYVKRGGSLVVFPSLALLRAPNVSPNAPYALGPVRQAAAGEEAWGIESFEKDHPLFALLAARAPGLVSDVAVSAAVDLGAPAAPGAPAIPGGRVLATLPGARPLLVEQESGQGRRLVWAVGLHPDWSDLPLRPLFVPLLFEMIKAAAAGSGQALPLGTVDQGFTWQLPAADAPGLVRVLTPAGVKLDARLERGTSRLTFDQADAPGFYTIEPGGRTEGEAPLAGVNIAGEESDLRRAPQDEVQRYFPDSTRPRIVRDGGEAVQRLAYATRGFAFAHWLLALALAALLAATWLGNSLITPELDDGAPAPGGLQSQISNIKSESRGPAGPRHPQSGEGRP